MTSTELERALHLAGLSAPAHWHEVTGSTNAIAAELARRRGARVDPSGRGSPDGRARSPRANVGRPAGWVVHDLARASSRRIGPDDLGLLTLLAGAAWAEVATEVSGLEVRCKWPNDLLVGDAKVGGVLAESSVTGDEVRWVVARIGTEPGGPRRSKRPLGSGAPASIASGVARRLPVAVPPRLSRTSRGARDRGRVAMDRGLRARSAAWSLRSAPTACAVRASRSRSTLPAGWCSRRPTVLPRSPPTTSSTCAERLPRSTGVVFAGRLSLG